VSSGKFRIRLPLSAWDVANLFWIVYLIALSVVNFVIATQFSTEVWVNFKVFGALIVTAVVALVQTCCLSMVPPEEYDTSEGAERRGRGRGARGRSRALEEGNGDDVNVEGDEEAAEEEEEEDRERDHRLGVGGRNAGQEDIELLLPTNRRQ